MRTLAFEVLLIVLLLVFNGIFSMSELAIVSARRVRLRQMAESGSKGAAKAIELAENSSRFLSTVQIGITLVGILAGAFGGATIAGVLANFLADLPYVGPYSSTFSFALVVAVITYFSIVVGELIPKSLALNAPEKIAVAVSRPMMLLSRFSSPVVWMLMAPTSLVLRLFKVQATVDPPVTDEEIKDLIDVGTKAGVFQESEQGLMESVINLGDQRISSLMTPRLKIEWMDLNDPVDKIRETLQDCRFSRLPAARGKLDDVCGYVSAKALLSQIIKRGDLDPEAVLQSPIYVPETLTILELLERFRTSHTHFAVVVDEFGGVEGLITMNDVLEAIVGELPASQHFVSGDLITRAADGTLVADGRTPIFEFLEELDIKELPADERDAYHTLAGFVLARLGKVPKTGDRFTWHSIGFTIAAMEQNRVATVIVNLPDQEG